MTKTNSTTTHRIDDGWRFRNVAAPDSSPDLNLAWLPAEIPGHVHLDLMRAGVLADPFRQMYEKSAEWVDRADWQYETKFHLENAPSSHTILHFEGLDTIAEISLNGQPLGTTDNMFVPHEFEVGPLLRHGAGDDGDNTLQVVFRSALRTGLERRAAWHGTSEDTIADSWYRFGPQSFVRKAQYMFGWDWGPVLISAGIWRPVTLIEIPAARLLDWSYDVSFLKDGSADVIITQYVDRAPNAASAPLQLRLAWPEARRIEEAVETPLPEAVTIDVPQGTGRVAATATVRVKDAQIWWPNRHNPEGSAVHPVLYTLETSLIAGETIDSRIARIGLRTVELIREPDADGKGEGFKFQVNGHDMFVRGANWIPEDSFVSRLENDPGKTGDTEDGSDPRVHNLIVDVCDAGYNMLRIWGGGIYESEHFYELCDEHGILVWQDFAYACAYYPDTGAYADGARREATEAVRRLRSHPSLAIWCGNNENHMMFHGKWDGVQPSRYLGEKFYHGILPEVLAREDPGRPYWPSSPYGGDDPNSPDFGDRHNWDVWHGVGDWVHYTEDTSRFASEFGFASSCSLTAWETCLDEDDWTPYSPAVRWHDKTRKGYDTYIGYVHLHYPEIKTLEDLVYYSQLNQADALSYGIEHYRRLKGRCWGTMFWQINDCWPVQSWAIVDSALEPKAAFHASRRFYAPVLLSLHRVGDEVTAHVVNDRLSDVSGSLIVQIRAFNGDIVAQTVVDATVAANTAAQAATLSLGAARGREREVYVTASFCESDDQEFLRARLFLAEPKDLALPPADLRISVADEDKETLRVTLETETLAASVWLHVDSEIESPPAFSDNFFHLEPGETQVVTVSKTDEISDPVSLQELLRVRTLSGSI